MTKRREQVECSVEEREFRLKSFGFIIPNPLCLSSEVICVHPVSERHRNAFYTLCDINKGHQQLVGATGAQKGHQSIGQNLGEGLQTRHLTSFNCITLYDARLLHTVVL